MTTRPITQDALNAARRHLNMAVLSLPELGALIEKHHDNPGFTSRVIASAARQTLEEKGAMADEFLGALACR